MTFEIYKDRKKEYRWRLRSKNGKKIADGAEGYKTKRPCIRTYNKLMNLVCDGRKDAIKLSEV
jgi:uncharacterized protein YegP (UPF0339 family)